MDPASVNIFHITHLENLPSIIRKGGLWSDAEVIRQKIDHTNIGYPHIKERRLQREVTAGARGKLGEYVPFNFCPRSVMLSVMFYRSKQEPIVHLVSTAAIAADRCKGWAFTDRHAEVELADYFDDMANLETLDWSAINEKWWKSVKTKKQAEFLVPRFFPWDAIIAVGVKRCVAKQVQEILGASTHCPSLLIREEWYYP